LMAEEMFPKFRDGPLWDGPLWDGPLWDGPLWLDNPAVTDRAYVLMAMGMVSVASGLRLEDSLAALRAHAYLVDHTLDATAHAYLVDHTLDATARAVVNRVLPADAIADI